MTTEEIIKILEAYQRGDIIEYKSKLINGAKWNIANTPVWNFDHFDYRIKEELLQGKTKAERDAIEKAYKDGKIIEFYSITRKHWAIMFNPCWAWGSYDYRIKPEPAYIPYTSETWKQHIEKFRNMFVVNSLTGTFHRICGISEHVFCLSFGSIMKYDELYQWYKWEDGTPCGTLRP